MYCREYRKIQSKDLCMHPVCLYLSEYLPPAECRSSLTFSEGELASARPGPAKPGPLESLGDPAARARRATHAATAVRANIPSMFVPTMLTSAYVNISATLALRFPQRKDLCDIPQSHGLFCLW